MATPRSSPYIYATWLSKMISGRATCHWQFWFQTHNKIKKRPDDFSGVEWKMEHTRMLNDLRGELIARGLKPMLHRAVKMPLGTMDAILGGEIDCLTVDEDCAVVYDCKTGEPHASDQVQVMIYMHMLAQEPPFRTRRISGQVIYRDDRVSIPVLPEMFLSHLQHYIGLLLSGEPAPRNMGADCMFCSITEADCVERSTACTNEPHSDIER